MHASREKVSAFVVSFNRAALIGTCVRALRFADEVIVVDKSSTDATPAIAARHADRVITVPWSPTADETRNFALAQCSHDWIVFVDDDECLSPEAVQFIEAELAAPRADAYAFPLRHYILGVHDERAYYWPEHHIRMFCRGAVAFSATVHACVVPRSDRVFRVAADTGACIHHLSHQDVAQWIEKANRYTSCVDRARVGHAGSDLIGFAHARIDHWLEQTRDATPSGYPQAVALLRATYDLIDRLKTWEEERGLDGAALFSRVCAELDAAHGGALPARPGERCAATPPAEPSVATDAALLASLREQYDVAMRAAADALAAAELGWAQELAETRAALCAECRRAELAETAHGRAALALRAIEDSTFWRATAWPRRVAGRLRAQR